MADDTTPATETVNGDKPPPPNNDKDAADDVKAMQAALRKANKEAETTRLKLKEYEDRDKSELDKVIEKTTEAEQRAAVAERSLMQYRVAAAKNLPAKLATRLHGDTEDEMGVDADELLAEMTPAPFTPRIPAGARNGQPDGVDMNTRIRSRMR